MNTNLIHKWLRDPKFAPDLEVVKEQATPAPCFLPVEIVDQPATKEQSTARAANTTFGHSTIEIDIAGGHPLRIVGGYDPEALARPRSFGPVDPRSFCMIPVPANTRVWLAAGVTPSHTCRHVLPGSGHAARVHDAGGPGRTNTQAGSVHRAPVCLS